MSRHQKRIASPKSWQIERKKYKWIVRPRPGHSKERSLPLLVIIRDILKLADNSREAKRILNEGKILVNGRVRKDYKFSVGIFDILSIPLLEKHFRVLTDRKGRLTLTEISEKDAETKLCRVENKTTVKGGKIQLNLHDGRNIISSDDIKTKDSVIISLNDGKIVDKFSYREGSRVIVLGGKHSGEIGKIKSIKKVRSSRPNTVVIQKENGEEFETIEDYVFVVGEEKVEL
ncbi:MAG: 30S ribosomal protein S4e, partial [Candidatus Syntropharchaeia archaeon]